MPLASVVDVRESVAPRGLPHFDRLRAATVTGNLAQGAPLGERARRRCARSPTRCCRDGQGYRVDLLGRVGALLRVGQRARLRLPARGRRSSTWCWRRSSRASSTRSRSWSRSRSRSPARSSRCWLAGSTLNLFSQIGLVMLVGLVTKNSILIVEFANQLRERGMGSREATFEASRIRFRPILMTALVDHRRHPADRARQRRGRRVARAARHRGGRRHRLLDRAHLPRRAGGVPGLRASCASGRPPRARACGRAGDPCDAGRDLARYGSGSIAQRGSTLQSTSCVTVPVATSISRKSPIPGA